MKRTISILSLCLSALMLFSCLGPTENQQKPWCLIFYMEGGERDYFEQAYIRQAAAACWDSTSQGWQQKTAMTVLYNPSPSWQEKKEWKGTHRFYTRNGQLVKDTVFHDEFISANDTTLGDYIRWARQKYPDHRYVLIPVGHGVGWYPISEPPYSVEHLRDTTLPWHPFITTAQLREAIAMSGGRIEMIYFNMCMMNQVESLAEWMESARYIMATNNPTPDVGSDYGMLVKTLQKEGDFKENMRQYLDWNFSIWKEFANGPFTPDLTLTDMDAFAQVLPAWKAFTNELLQSLGDTVRCTDAPARFGDSYEEGYIQAFRDSWTRYGFTFATDMRDYAYKAVSHTGNMDLIPLLRQVDEALANCCVFRRQHDDGNTLSFAITTPINIWDYTEHGDTYRNLRFCQETGWNQWIEKACQQMTPDAAKNKMVIRNGAPTGTCSATE